MDLESIDNHIKHLSNQHMLLENTLDKIYKQKSWNEFDVEKLKKEKLRLKDQLAALHRRRHGFMNALDVD